jgi:membrane-bound lytic murein transglycosylase D
MIVKYFIIAFMACLLITASDPYFGTDLSWRPIPKEIKSDVQELPWMSTTAFRPYLMDHKQRVSEAFRVTPYYYPNVHFWFLIYTQFESSSVVIHDKNNLSLIYKVLDFSSLHEKKLHRNTIYVLQQKISKDKLSALKDELEELSKEPFSLSPSAKRIYRTLKHAGVDLPLEKKARHILFNQLKNNLRTQTGQKNFIREGVMRSLPYQDYLGGYFSNKKLPKELLGIPFLESSFNPRAHSKVNALGAWQFMPLIASYFIPKRTTDTDYRSNVGVSSVAASFLLAENFMILKSWDLAVTAYNSGTKHLLKTKRELASDNVDLEKVIKHSDSEHFGFASKNFYSEFLALAHTLAYREELFDDLHDHDRPDVTRPLLFFMAKCPLKLPRILKEPLLEDINFHNHHIRDLQKTVPRGFILTTKAELPKNKFLKINYKQLQKIRPKDWVKLLKGHSCSTK